MPGLCRHVHVSGRPDAQEERLAHHDRQPGPRSLPQRRRHREDLDASGSKGQRPSVPVPAGEGPGRAGGLPPRGPWLAMPWDEPGLGPSILAARGAVGMLQLCSVSPAPAPHPPGSRVGPHCPSPAAPSPVCPLPPRARGIWGQTGSVGSGLLVAPYPLPPRGFYPACAWPGATAGLVTRLPSRSPPLQLKTN